MEEASNIVGLIDFALSLCSTIYRMAANVKGNKERCQLIAKRVRAMEALVLKIKQRALGHICDTVENALQDLCGTLQSAKTLMTKFSQTKKFKSFMRSGSLKDSFQDLNTRLDHDSQVLTTALQIEQGDMLQRVHDTLSGKTQNGDYCSSGQAYTCPPSTVPPMPMPMPMPMPCPPTPTPLPCIIPPSPLPGMMPPLPLYTTCVPRPAVTMIAPRVVVRTVAPMAPIAPLTLTRSIGFMTLPPQNTLVASSYMVNNPFFN